MGIKQTDQSKKGKSEYQDVATAAIGEMAAHADLFFSGRWSSNHISTGNLQNLKQRNIASVINVVIISKQKEGADGSLTGQPCLSLHRLYPIGLYA